MLFSTHFISNMYLVFFLPYMNVHTQVNIVNHIFKTIYIFVDKFFFCLKI